MRDFKFKLNQLVYALPYGGGPSKKRCIYRIIKCVRIGLNKFIYHMAVEKILDPVLIGQVPIGHVYTTVKEESLVAADYEPKGHKLTKIFK